jgi:hypothetical protein
MKLKSDPMEGPDHESIKVHGRADNTKTLWSGPIRPITQADGHEFPWPIDELVPGVAAVIDDIVVGFEDPI